MWQKTTLDMRHAFDEKKNLVNLAPSRRTRPVFLAVFGSKVNQGPKNGGKNVIFET